MTGSNTPDGWRDRFLILGYEFYVWCPERAPQELFSILEEDSQLYVDALQINKMLDLFDASAGILKNYGFDVTLERIERIENISEPP